MPKTAANFSPLKANRRAGRTVEGDSSTSNGKRVSEVPNGTRHASYSCKQRQKTASSSGGPLC